MRKVYVVPFWSLKGSWPKTSEKVPKVSQLLVLFTLGKKKKNAGDGLCYLLVERIDGNGYNFQEAVRCDISD